MGKYFFITVMMSAIFAQTLGSANNLVLLGKPPLARPEERIRSQIQKYRKMFANDRDKYFNFLHTLHSQIQKNINDALGKLQDNYQQNPADTLNLSSVQELHDYIKVVDDELQTIAQVIEFESTNTMNTYLEYKKQKLSSKDFQNLVEKMIEETINFLLNNHESFKQKKEAEVCLKILNQALK